MRLPERDRRDQHASRFAAGAGARRRLCRLHVLTLEEVEEEILRLVRARISNGKDTAMQSAMNNLLVMKFGGTSVGSAASE